MISLSTRAAVAAVCFVALPGLASAQAPSPADSTDARLNAARPVQTLMVMAPDSSFAARPASPDVTSMFRRRQGLDRPTVLMIVGGALILTGLIVDDEASTLLYIAGAGVGAYGLYLYLQMPDTRFTR